MDDLTAFITGRLDEDEAIAMAAAADASRFAGRANWTSEAAMVTDAEDPDWAICDLSPLVDDECLARHVARHDPARALREVAARRRTMARHEREPDRRQPWCAWCTDDRHFEAWPCDDIRDLVATWSDHGDYRPEWAPGHG